MDPRLGQATTTPKVTQPVLQTSAAGGSSNVTITAVAAPASEPFGDIFGQIDRMTVADLRAFIHLFRKRYSIDPRPEGK